MAFLIKRTPRPTHKFGHAQFFVSAQTDGHENEYFTAEVVRELAEFSTRIRGADHYETPTFVAAPVASLDGDVHVVVGPLLDRATYGVEKADKFSFAYGWALEYGVKRGCMRAASTAEIADWHARRAAYVRDVEASDEARMLARGDELGRVLAMGQMAADEDL